MNGQEIERIQDLARFHFQRYGGILETATVLGITIVGIQLPACPEFRAVAIELKNGNQYIIYNQSQPENNQHHCIGHELFHLVAEHPNGLDLEREAGADLYAETVLKLRCCGGCEV